MSVSPSYEDLDSSLRDIGQYNQHRTAQRSMSYKSYKVRYPKGQEKDVICGGGGSVHTSLRKEIVSASDSLKALLSSRVQ